MPKHDFLLLPEVEGRAFHYADHFHDPRAVKLDDDLVLYMLDALNWIPSSNPSNPGEWCGYGLNYFGPTVIDKRGAEKAAQVFRLWAALFEAGPEQLELTGSFEWIEGGRPAEGRYATFTEVRETVVESLRNIAALADKAATGPIVLLHLGI